MTIRELVKFGIKEAIRQMKEDLKYNPYVDHPTWQECKGCELGNDWQTCEPCWTLKTEECTRENKEVRK